MQGQTPESEIEELERREDLARIEYVTPSDVPDPDMMAWLDDPLGEAVDEDPFDIEMFQVPTDDGACSKSTTPSPAGSGEAIDKLDLIPNTGTPIAIDDDIAAILGDSHSPEDLEGLGALSLTEPDVDALVEASERMQAEADLIVQEVDYLPVIEEIRDLRDSLVSFQGLEHSLVELSQNSESTSIALTKHLDLLFDEVAGLRRETEITRDATLVFTNTVRELVSTMSKRKSRLWRRRGEGSGKLGFATLTIALLLSIAAIGWAVRGYQQTGELHFAVIGLLVVNLVGGGAVIWSQRD